MVNDGQRWSMVVSNDHWWSVMVSNVQQRSLMVSDGQRLKVVGVVNNNQWSAMVRVVGVVSQWTAAVHSSTGRDTEDTQDTASVVN